MSTAYRRQGDPAAPCVILLFLWNTGPGPFTEVGNEHPLNET
jgi:hypothetical protein